MTKEEFIHRYSGYWAATKEDALAEIEHMDVVEGHLVEAVEFKRPKGWAIMLDTAVAEIKRLDMIWQ